MYKAPRQLQAMSAKSDSDWLLLLQELRDHNRQMLDRVCQRTTDGLPSVETFKTVLARSGYQDGTSVESAQWYKPKADANLMQRRLYQLFGRLSSDEDRKVIRPHNLSEEIGRLLKNDLEATDLMTEWMGRRLDDMTRFWTSTIRWKCGSRMHPTLYDLQPKHAETPTRRL